MRGLGGCVPLGYDVKDRKLVVNEAEAATVHMIFERFVRLGSTTKLVRALAADGVLNKRGTAIDKMYLYRLIGNRIYLGDAVHKGIAYPGEHSAIISRELWDKAHAVLKINPGKRAGNTRAQTPSLLRGLVFGPSGQPMTPSHTRKRNKLYRYYIAIESIKRGDLSCPVRRVPAAEIEAAVVDQLRGMFRAPKIIVGTWLAARPRIDGLREADVRDALIRLDPLWDELFPAEQARLVQLLVERVDVGLEGIDIRLRTAGLESLVQEIGDGAYEQRREA